MGMALPLEISSLIMPFRNTFRAGFVSTVDMELVDVRGGAKADIDEIDGCDGTAVRSMEELTLMALYESSAVG